MASKLKLTELLYPTSTTPAITINADDTVTFGAPTTTITNLSATSITDSGNLTFTGTGNRILGDFSNATAANRVIFQTSTASANTRVGMMPNLASGGTSGPVLYSTSDPSNSSIFDIRVTDTSVVSLLSDKAGTGTYLPMTFQTGGSEAMRITTDRNVGIGTISPQAPLNVSYSNAARGDTLRLTNTNTGGYGPWLNFYGDYSSGYSFAKIGAENETTGATLRFHTADTSKVSQERMRIDSSGNVGIGVSPAASVKLEINGSLRISGAMGSVAAVGGGNFSYEAPITRAYVGDGTGYSWAFSRRVSSTTTDLVTISDSGSLSIGKTAASESYTSGSGFGFASPTNPFFSVVNLASSSNNACIYLNQRNTTSTNSLIVFLTNNGSSQSSVGSIYHNGTNTTYATSSDYRLKNITGELTKSGTFIDALKPKVGTWKSNGSPFVGFLAHEFAEVSPSSVSGEKDAVDKNGNPEYQGMQASSSEVMANIIAELQSLRRRVAELESI
jgi:hypothetical protein